MNAATALSRPAASHGLACQSSAAGAFRNASGRDATMMAWPTATKRGTGFRSAGHWSVLDRKEPVPVSSLVAIRLADTNAFCVRAQSQEVGRSSEEEEVDDTSPFSLNALWRSLEPSVVYLGPQGCSTVRDALELAFFAHDGQRRKSGEPFITHPVEVARILAGMEMDWEAVVAGLLHDTVEDTDAVSFADIERRYGTGVRRIVEGETKVSKLAKVERKQADVKADDLRQMFLAMTEEVRVIVVKLADRLHNMRTLGHMPPHKQERIAKETLKVFAPLARLLGMYTIKSELEDMAFRFAHPEEYCDVVAHIRSVWAQQQPTVQQAKTMLDEAISHDMFLRIMTSSARVEMRCREPYSIFKKSQHSDTKIADVRDVSQVRIILDLQPPQGSTHTTVDQARQVCYHMLGLVHAIWKPIPGTVKDYIATPKQNGYQSLHTTVLPIGADTLFPLEVQIRTSDMHRMAEWGIAGHRSSSTTTALPPSPPSPSPSSVTDTPSLSPSPTTTPTTTTMPRTATSSPPSLPPPPTAFSPSGRPITAADVAQKTSWLQAIRGWQEEFVGSISAREFVEAVTGDILGSRIFVFTPKGEVLNLPDGSTVVDYAYHIHTDLGNRMIAAKVNGRVVPPTHRLCNGEVVEIVTYPVGTNSRKAFSQRKRWLQYAKTRTARYKLTKYLKEQAALQAEELTSRSVDDFVARPDSREVAEGSSSSDRLLDTGANDLDYSGRNGRTGQQPEPLTVPLSSSNNGSSRSSELPSDEPTPTSPPAPVSSARPASTSGAPNQSVPAYRTTESASNGAVSTNGSAQQLLRGTYSNPAADDSSSSRASGNIEPRQVELMQQQQEQRQQADMRPLTGKGGKVELTMPPSMPSNGSAMQAASEAALQELRDDFEAWQQQTVAMWQFLSGKRKSVKWLSVSCRDRSGLLAEVSTILTESGLLISTHSGRTDRMVNFGIMLFEWEGPDIDLAQIQDRLLRITGVASTAFGCTLPGTLLKT